MTAKEREELLIRIDERTTATYHLAMKTNGRVTALEKWRAYIVGGGTILIIIVGWIVQTK